MTEASLEKLNTNFNAVILDKKDWPTQFIFNRYKTDKYFGQQIFNLNPQDNGQLMSILSFYIKDDEINSSDFLFRKPGSLKQHTASEFSDLTGSYF